MDARLTTLLPHALGLRPGDGKVIKNAGAIITHPFGGITRSVFIAIYELGATEVYVVGHRDCGMSKDTPSCLACHITSIACCAALALGSVFCFSRGLKNSGNCTAVLTLARSVSTGKSK